VKELMTVSVLSVGTGNKLILQCSRSTKRSVHWRAFFKWRFIRHGIRIFKKTTWYC
jgi:hypothetical protein